MTYTGSEVSKHGGKPTELYKFEGTYANFFYTSGPKKVRYPDEVGGDIYLPIALRRSEINCGTQDDDGLDLNIEMSVQNELVKIYGFQNSPPALDLTILRYHELDDVISYWTGPVNDIQIANGVATIRSLSTLGAALEANFPNVFFQSPCNHVLYDTRCKVSYDDWSFSAVALDINGRVLTVDSVGTLGGKLVGGEVLLASGERRMITAQNATEVIVNFPFSQIAEDDPIMLAAGCDLAYKGDCKVKFDNNVNFGGFPFVPSSNPFADGIDPAVVPLVDNTCLPQTEPCPAYRSLGMVVPGCNPAFWPTTNLYIPNFGPPGFENVPNPPIVPGGPSGIGLVFNQWLGNPQTGTGSDQYAEGFIYESNAYNDPDDDNYLNPDAIRLQGQLLVEWTKTPQTFFIKWHFALGGPLTLDIQYGAFFCGSVGEAATNMTFTDCVGGELDGECIADCTPIVMCPEEPCIVGNVAYHFENL